MSVVERAARSLGQWAVCLGLSAAACEANVGAPAGRLSYSANPAPAGEVVITAVFDRPLEAAPSIHIIRPGGAATAGAMYGDDYVWRFDYTVLPEGPLALIHEPAVVTISGIPDAAGNPVVPLVDRSLFLHAPGAVEARASLHSAEFVNLDAPVFTAGGPGAWDGGRVGAGDVVEVGGQYWMYYTGFDAQGESAGIGLATSRDKLTWDRRAAPVIARGAPGDWDSGTAIHPTVVWDGSRYHLWYIGAPTGGDNASYRFGHTTSLDGVNWERATPVLVPGPAGAWDEERIGGLGVALRGGAFHLYYAATTLTPEFERQIGCARSLDGASWTKCAANPVFSPDPAAADFEGNEVEEPEVADFYGAWIMAYSGYGGSQGARFHVGLAYSTDGLRWERLLREPALAWGASDSFDATGAGQPSILVEGNDLWLWYTGYSYEGSAIGLAVATLE